jgi:ADP-ribose pyrophosphatase YjhB (NUDIX family)
MHIPVVQACLIGPWYYVGTVCMVLQVFRGAWATVWAAPGGHFNSTCKIQQGIIKESSYCYCY